MLIKISYILKPLIPRYVQIILRRFLVNIKRKKYENIWPILEKAGSRPLRFPGWKNDKRFAFIITHDVEKQGGHDKCIQLMEIEKELGFKSSFNFVPELYNVSSQVRKQLTVNGFEVGVHGLNHDGKLFSSKEVFSSRAKKINEYLKLWNAVGFRAPAMHHNLEWQHDLNIKYDLSTFDIDPFEPQADGVETIFPYWVGDDRGGFWEFPYTLVQDFTLFILMSEKNIDIWKRKIDWIVEKGGMVLVNVHPDYINFDDKRTLEEFPLNLYTDLLNYVKAKYSEMYWNPLPKELAEYLDNKYK
jgi:peptidoglycan/xylan/chitin deacetylase (PgdA/CDA1 family)